MFLKCIRSFYSGSCSYCVGRIFFKCAKSSELLADSITKCPTLWRPLSAKLTVEEVREEKSRRVLQNKSKDKHEENVTRETRPRKTVSKEIEEYFMQKPSLAQVRSLIPEKLLRRRRKTDDSLYLVDQDVAVHILESIKKDVVKDECFVLEGNPGLGLLSRELIKAGVKRLHLFENHEPFLKHLENLQRMYPEKISITPYDIFSIWKLACQDKMDRGIRVKTLLSHFPKQDWIEEPALKIVGAVRCAFFLKHLILSVVFQNSIIAHCRPEFYLVLPPSLHEVLTCSRDAGYRSYRYTTVLFQLFFDHEVLAMLPRKAFVPWSQNISSKTPVNIAKALEMDQEFLYLMKAVPKKDLFEKVSSPDNLPLLWCFVLQHMQKRRSKVIPKMESWVPNCGPRLILDGYNIYTEFGDLSPQQLLSLFNQFRQWPEFPDSSFTSSLEMTLLKFEESADESVDKNDDMEEKELKLEEVE